MFIVTIISVVCAWVPAQSLSRKWGRGILVPVAAIIGLVCAIVANILVAFFMSTGSGEGGVFEIFVHLLANSFWAIFIAPIAAIVGWRRSINPPQPSTPPPWASNDLTPPPEVSNDLTSPPEAPNNPKGMKPGSIAYPVLFVIIGYLIFMVLPGNEVVTTWDGVPQERLLSVAEIREKLDSGALLGSYMRWSQKIGQLFKVYSTI